LRRFNVKQLVVNTKTLTDIKEFNPFKELTFYNYSKAEIQQILIIMSFIDWAKSKDIISKELEVTLGVI